MRPGPCSLALFLTISTIAAIIPAPVAAAEELDVEITPFAGYRFGGTFELEGSTASYEIDDSETFGLLFNLRQTDKTQWEVLYSQQQSIARLRNSTSTTPTVDVDIHVLQLGGTYQGNYGAARPYLAMTLGGTHIKTNANGSQSDTFFSGSIGVGLNFIPNKRLGFRLEARVYGTLTDSSTDLFCQTGPDANFCAVRIEGTVMSQVETFAGVVFRF